jgi:fucose permease
MNLQTLPIFLAFFLMGLADAMGPDADPIKKAYSLNNVNSTLVSFAVFIAFAVCSVPGGLLSARIGKKKLLLLGLGINCLALIIPSLMVPSFPVLLVCIFMLGIGTTFLQVAGNPIMRDVSPPGAYSRNLAFAQGIKGIGSTASIYIVLSLSAIAFFKSMDWRAAFPLFCLLMLLALVTVALLDVKETKAAEPPGIGSSLALLGQPVFALAVLGIFLYVGAEQCLSRFLKPTLNDLGMDESAAKAFGPTLFMLAITVGRLVAGNVKVSPHTFFRLSAVLGLAGTGLLMTGDKTMSLAGVVIAGLGFANVWPMLFSITVEEKPEKSNELSGLMCMAISGGALVPLLMGALEDKKLQALSFVVPATCFVYLLLLSFMGGSKSAPAATAPQS